MDYSKVIIGHLYDHIKADRLKIIGQNFMLLQMFLNFKIRDFDCDLLKPLTFTI